MRRDTISLSDALFSKVRQRVLALFFNHPNEDFHTNEIIRLTHSGTGAVQRELASLSQTGIITVKQLGNQKRYQVNHAAPIFSELASIVSKTFGVGDQLRQTLNPLAKKITVAFIYGSVAKNTDNANSDIDMMIISDKLSYGDIFNRLETTEEQLGRKINPTCYSTAELHRKMKDNHFVKKVLSQEKIFLIGSESKLEKFR